MRKITNRRPEVERADLTACFEAANALRYFSSTTASLRRLRN
jgi:hypothetical protein